MAASRKAHENTVRILLNNGADINACEEYRGTALIIACHFGHMAIVGYLLEEGADVNIEAGRHGTALRAALNKGNVEIMRTLLAHESKADTWSNQRMMDLGITLQSVIQIPKLGPMKDRCLIQASTKRHEKATHNMRSRGRNGSAEQVT